MGRPRNDSTDISATERIEKAFWELLENGDYSSITIQQITKKTGLNRNTIYYHYENVDDIAHKSFCHAISESNVNEFISFLLYERDFANENTDPLSNTRKIHLMAKSDSPFLHKLVKDAMIEAWMKAFGIDKSALEEMDWVNLDFISAGIIALISNEQLLRNSNIVCAFPKSLLGQTIIQILKKMPKLD